MRTFIDSLDGTTLVVGACDPLATPRPSGPLHDFATDPAAGLGELAGRDIAPLDRFEIVLYRLRHSIRPIVMVVEDIHWADEGTLDFLRFVGRRIADAKALMVCTYRDDEVGIDHEDASTWPRPATGPSTSTSGPVVSRRD